MGRTLFIGCSHSMGFMDPGGDMGCRPWQENNYGEIYARELNKKVTIMASAGMGNREIPNFLAHALKTYDDIDEVFVQATYWGRFPIAFSPTLNEKDILPLDFFIDKVEESELIDKYEIGLIQPGNYWQEYFKPLPDDFDHMPYVKETNPYQNQPDMRRSSFMYVQMWHYLQTHLEQQDFFKDFTLCDVLCHEKNIPLYIWPINNRIFLPEQLYSFYRPLTNTKIIKENAIEYLQKLTDIDLEKEKVDSEHYNYIVHHLIATKFIPYIREKYEK